MKIEIDLEDLLYDENYGPESLQDSVRRQVIDSVKRDVISNTRAKIQEEINKQISDTVSEEIKKRLPELFEDILNAEYTPISMYGAKSEPTSFRKQLIKTIQDQMVYKKENYADHRNAFTKAVDNIIAEQLVEIKKDFEKQVSEDTAKQAFTAAVNLLKTKLGV